MGVLRKIVTQLDRGFVNGPLASPLVPRPIRRAVLRALGYPIDRTACIAELCYIGSREVIFEADSFANVGCFFDGNTTIDVAAGAQIGMWSVLASATHEISEHPGRRAGRDVALPIVIGEGTWLGARSTVLPGVHIQAGCVVGAGSLVIGDCDRDSLYVGSPARKVRALGGDRSYASGNLHPADTSGAVEVHLAT